MGFGPQLNPPRLQSGLKNDSTRVETAIGSKIVFSTSPSELPILPQKPLFNSKSTPTNLGIIEKEIILKRQSFGQDLTVTQFEDFTGCFPNWSSPPSHLMAAVSLDISIANPQLFLVPMLKRARMSLKEEILLEDHRYFLYSSLLLLIIISSPFSRWRLVAGYQSSFIGQLMQSLECSNQKQQLQSMISSNFPPDSMKRSDGPWDSILRSACRGGMFWEDVIPPKNRPVPLHIYCSTKEIEQTEGLNPQKRLMRVLSLSHQANLAVMIAEDNDSNTTLLPSTAISQWTLLQTFTLDAIKDIQPIFHSQLFSSQTSWNDEQEKEETEEGDALMAAVRKAFFQEQPELPGLVNLLLHILHATGAIFIYLFSSSVLL